MPVKEEAGWLRFLFRCFLTSTGQDHRCPLVCGSRVRELVEALCFIFSPVCQKATFISSRVPIHFLALALNVFWVQFFSEFLFRSEKLISFPPLSLTTFLSKALPSFYLFVSHGLKSEEEKAGILKSPYSLQTLLAVNQEQKLLP